jgi:ribosomal protein S11
LGFSRKFRVQRKKCTPAAQTAAEKAALEALSTGMKNVEILVKDKVQDEKQQLEQ